MDDMITRLKKIIDDAKLNQKEFAESIGLTPGGLNDILRGKTRQPAGSTVKAIEYKYRINGEWLLTGKGKRMLTGDKINDKDVELNELIAIYNSLDNSRKKVLLTFSRTLRMEQLQKMSADLKKGSSYKK